MKTSKLPNVIFKLLTFGAAICVIVLIVGMLLTLLLESWPALRRFGFFDFLFGRNWNYANQIFGALRPLTGTIISTGLALVMAVPVALGTAVFLVELCPHKLRSGIGTAIELLAAIPSIIYGMWGLFVLAPMLEENFQPLIVGTLGKLPLMGPFFQSHYAGGVNLFTAAVILAIMIIPFIAGIARDAFNQVPPILKESSYGVGATHWETIAQVILPYTKTAVAGGVIIAMGRALGETMAVAYVIGNRHGGLDSIFSPYVTITSVMANEFNEAAGLQMSSLFTLALVLLIANFMVLSLAKYVLRSKFN
ncbi:MAG: phosphate ABC transporter permease subunit PstC [Candidatus Adiutrix sp.]|jgi:phosphate transport system permease protein|nr:phosphate ABC transporter permease subunit PstC [Candidatus Adiutrix sp.]